MSKGERDLVILAGGKGDIVKLFERDAERTLTTREARNYFKHAGYE